MHCMLVEEVWKVV